ncbi:amidohydrolase family protein [Herbaspirillum sp. LeCh32-8]|uniref:amidohydrolase family protein n=1 Tax=Herbaspirillum sp. LeCh32-8 TaxID=2821356 RepID=UPI001AE0F3A7|nr:amidohydrolase family protein [Herbaspirillum sp. LeCh32-8]MBP0596569.1 amidohydrolase family protein [Herbaspirillum sp. LeCh32-8]
MHTLHDKHTSAAGPWAADALPIIDAHHHLWALASGHYPWLQDEYIGDQFFLGPYRSFCVDFQAPDYLQRSRRHPLVGTVHIEAERDRAEALAETEWLHQVHAQYGFPNAVVAYADFGAADIDDQLRRQAAFALVRGIRCKPTTAARPDAPRPQAGSMGDPRWLDGLQQLERYGLSWDVRVPVWHLEEAAAVAGEFPGIAIVVNHTGLPWDRSADGLGKWRRGLERLAAHPHVCLKLSEFGVRDADWNPSEVRQIIRQAIAIFGASRCMFGSNFPVSSLKVDYDLLVATFTEALSDLPREQAEAVMAGTAARFYRIEPAS